MNLKGKKKMNILLYILLVMVGGLIGAVTMALASANNMSELTNKNNSLMDRIDQQDSLIEDLEDTKSDLTVKNGALEQWLNTYKQMNIKLKEEIDLLNELVVHASEQNNSANLEKERLPDGPTNMFCFMDYKKLQNQTANQYWLQQECSINDMGICVYWVNDVPYFCAALGSAYGQDIGDTWRVTLKNGTSFNIILADCKGDDAGDEFGHKTVNYDGDKCINVIEFVVNPDCIPDKVKSTGTFSRLDIFGGLHGTGGNIAKMEYTGRVWTRN